MTPIAPRKSLGQNFLKDKNIAEKIVGLSDIKPEDHVVEIGPGEGALTGIILKRTGNLTAIEYDKRSVNLISEKFPNSQFPNFRIVNKDIREFDYSKFSFDIDAKIKVIGNIPYNISSDIIFQILENINIIDSAVLTIQKELAQRIVAKSRTKDYGILTVARDLVAKAKISFHIPPTAFFPKPAVTSSVLLIEPKEESIEIKEYNKIMKLVRAAFNNRRKTLRNSLRSHLERQFPASVDDFITYAQLNESDYFRKRAEELTTLDFIKLQSTIEAYINEC